MTVSVFSPVSSFSTSATEGLAPLASSEVAVLIKVSMSVPTLSSASVNFPLRSFSFSAASLDLSGSRVKFINLSNSS